MVCQYDLYCYYIPDTIRNVTITAQTDIPNYAFKNCDFIETITLCFKTETIGVEAFRNCAKLSEIDVGTSLISIGSDAFNGCIALEEITLPDTVTTLNSGVFFGCTSLSRMNSEESGTINIPKSVTIISYYAFQNCLSIRNVTVGNVTVVSGYAFDGCANIKSFNGNKDGELVIPNGVTYIGPAAFRGLVLITNVVVPDSVVTIDVGAFKGCDSITDMTLPFVGESRTATSSNTKVFGYILGSYSDGVSGMPQNIRNVTITSQVAIPAKAFYDCYFIETVTLAPETTTIGEYAFYNCSNLTSILISDSVTYIGTRAFSNCKRLTIFCELESDPNKWSGLWNESDCPVIWGFDAKEQTYSFVTNGADPIDPVKSLLSIVLPTPVRDGYYFAGWYDNADFSGSPVDVVYYSAIMHTLYAKWWTEEEWLAMNFGSSFGTAYELVLNQATMVVIDTMGEDVYYKFTAVISGTYTFSSTGEFDTHAYVYNDSYSKIGYSDDGGSNTNFSVSVNMTAGETVYIKVGSPAISMTGTFFIVVN